MSQTIEEIINEKMENKSHRDNDYAVKIKGKSMSELIDGIRDKIQYSMQEKASRPNTSSSKNNPHKK